MGTFDGEYVYNLSGQMVLRVDDDEIYNMEMPSKYLGVFEGSQATDLKGDILFRLED